MPRKQNRVGSLPVRELNAAGIDVGAMEIFVAVPGDCDAESVRSFPAFSVDLGAFHGPLHPETRQPVGLGGDRDQPVLPSMPGPAQTPHTRRPAAASKGLEPENEPRPCRHPRAVYTHKGTPEVRL